MEAINEHIRSKIVHSAQRAENHHVQNDKILCVDTAYLLFITYFLFIYTGSKKNEI